MRARTDREKREIIERIYHVWTESPSLRLGQLISDSLATAGKDPDIFYIEDGDLAKEIEGFRMKVSSHG